MAPDLVARRSWIPTMPRGWLGRALMRLDHILVSPGVAVQSIGEGSVKAATVGRSSPTLYCYPERPSHRWSVDWVEHEFGRSFRAPGSR